MFDYHSLFSLTNKTALVIGAGSGIGQACAEGLAAFGAHVVCADVRIAEAEESAKTIKAAGFSAEARQVDIRDSGSIQAMVQSIPQIDVLLCTPSINVRKPMLQISDEEFDRVISLNLRGTFLTLREVGKVMVQQGKGSIIVLSSIRSQVVEPGQSVYAATKAGVVQMIRALAAEVGTQTRASCNAGRSRPRWWAPPSTWLLRRVPMSRARYSLSMVAGQPPMVASNRRCRLNFT